ncbi:MAG: hypothetical protein MJE66_15260 [Proteobacteria bacterium]|nr:hypothetical protein [Pseudomonadota bacterium]
MTCSKKYRDLVVTADGDTPENPYGLYPTPFDFEDWRTLAARLLVRTKAHLDRLQEAEKSAEETSTANGFVDEYNLLIEQYDALPSVFVGTFHEMDTRRSIALASALSVDSVCLMESIDKALGSLGLTPPGEHRSVKPTPSPATRGFQFGTLAVLAGGAYLLWRFGR